MRKWLLVITAVLLVTSGTQATTYYVAEKASSGNGLTWATAFNSISNINSNVSGGDTVFFGTGTWRGLLRARGGTFNDRTCYASSSFADTNAAGEYHFAKIYGSQDMSGGWSSIGGNRYQKSWSGYRSDPILYQEDTILWRQTSLAGVNSPGEWYYSGGVVTVYVNDFGLGYNPDSYEIEMAEDHTVSLDLEGTTDGQDNITFWGLEFKYTYVFSIVTTINSMEVDPYDSVFIDHCKLSMNAGWYGSNPAIIYSGYSGGTPLGRFNRVRACSLSNSWGLSDVDYQPYSNKGSAINHYSQSDYLIDSCVFHGYFKEGAVYWKSAYGGPKNENNVIRHNLFVNDHGSGVEFFGAVYKAEIYGNVFIGIDKAFYDRYDDWTGMGYHRIYNNTFVDCIDLMTWSTGDGVVPPTNSEFKYNVVYNSGNIYCNIDSYSSSGGSQFIDINRNLYYAGGSYQFVVNGSSNNVSQWQSRGIDVSSSFGVTPGFNNLNNDDFRRLNATQEMDTTYGGTRWLLYGALQAGASPPPPDTDPPIISSVGANTITQSSANIVWTTNEGATSQVQYGTTTGYGSTTPLNSTLLTGHTVQLSGLAASTLYHYRVISTDVSGNTRTGSDNTFSTSAPPPPDVTPPVISGVGASGVNASTATIVWTTDEAANSRVEYGLTTSYGQSTTLNSSYSTSHTEGLSGLDSSTIYHYRVISADTAGNSSASGDFTFTSLSQTQNNIAVGATPTVSGSYGGYSPNVLTDGVYNPRTSAATWASDESSTAPHWVEIDLGQPMSINSVAINWSWNPGQNTWMTSQQYSVQSWNGASWVDLHYQVNSTADSASITSFGAVNTSRIRVYQPANMGPVGYTVIMWIAEIEIFGGSASGDVTPPAAINDLGWVPQDDDITSMIFGANNDVIARPAGVALPALRRSEFVG